METTIPVAIIGLIAGLLAYHDDYDDGFVGRFAFSMIVTTSTIMVLGTVLGHYAYELPLEITVLLWGVVLFMVRHAWRFMHYRISGKYSWDGKFERRKFVRNDSQGAKN